MRTSGYDLSLAGFQQVTCGSVLKIANVDSSDRLHSHDVKYGSGSGQQVCTVCLGGRERKRLKEEKGNGRREERDTHEKLFCMHAAEY